MNIPNEDTKNPKPNAGQPPVETENTGQGEKKGGDFGQAGNQSADEGNIPNRKEGTVQDDDNSDAVTTGIETENSGQGEKKAGDFGQAADPSA